VHARAIQCTPEHASARKSTQEHASARKRTPKYASAQQSSITALEFLKIIQAI
jgi:hypothetical protein